MHWKANLVADDAWLESHGERPMAIYHDTEGGLHTSLLCWTETFAGLGGHTEARKSYSDPSCSLLSQDSQSTGSSGSLLLLCLSQLSRAFFWATLVWNWGRDFWVSTQKHSLRI
jgi:hypothetical protein